METQTEEALESENTELDEVSEPVEVGAIIDEITAEEQAEDPDKKVEDDPTGNEFTPTDEQVAMAKLLSMTDDEIANMTEHEAFAISKVSRLESRRQQRRGKEALKNKADDPKDPPPASVDSSTDEDPVEKDGDYLTEDDLYTPEAVKKINDIHRRLQVQEARDKKQQTSEKDRLQVKYDEVFDGLDPKIFPNFLPGESDEIEANSPAETRRDEVVTMAKAIAATRDAQGGEISLEESMQNALSILAPTETQNAAKQEADAGRKKRQGQRISAPSSSTAKHKVRQDTPEKQAVVDIVESLSQT